MTLPTNFDDMVPDDFGKPVTDEEKAVGVAGEFAKIQSLHNARASWRQVAGSLYFLQGVILTIFWCILVLCALVVKSIDWWAAVGLLGAILILFSGVPGAQIGNAEKETSKTR